MEASAQQDAAAPSAEVVGQAFARQYYTILHQSPALVYRFYQDISKVGRPENNGDMSSTTTMDAINEKIKSYGALRAEIKSLDAQESYNSGVVVLVTGDMIKEDDSRQCFTQTFFLAPQDKGYFVLNDIFRYADDDYHHNGNQDLEKVAPSTEDHDPSPVQDDHISERVEEASGRSICNPPESGEGSFIQEEEPVAEVVDDVPSELQTVSVVESNTKVEEMPKKSYASIVKFMKEIVATAPFPAPPKPMFKKQEHQVTVPSPPNSVAELPVSNINMVEDGNNPEMEGDGHSIYVKNLPMNAIPAMLEEAFKRFGPIKSGGIQVRSNKGFCFGFVEFEVPSAAVNAIEASPIMIGGRQVGVEEKKSTGSRGNLFAGGNRGRFPLGRAGGFSRNDGGRVRGSFGGGRGYGRGSDANKNEFGSRGNSRGYQNRGSSDGYQRSNHHVGGNGGSRMSRAGGSAVDTEAKAQGVTASA